MQATDDAATTSDQKTTGPGLDAGKSTVSTDTPDQVLDERRKRVQELENQLNAVKRDLDWSRADLTKLDQASGEAGKTVKAYEDKRPALDERRGDLDQYRKVKRPGIVAAVGNQKDRLDHEITWLEERLQSLRTTLDEALKKLVEGEQAQNQAERKLLDARATYELRRDLLKRIETVLTPVEALRKRIDAAEDALGSGDADQDRQRAREMYVGLYELDRLLEEVGPWLVDVATFREELFAAWGDVDSTQEAFRVARQERQKAQDKVDEIRNELDDLQGNRIDRVLQRLDRPPEPAGQVSSPAAPDASTIG